LASLASSGALEAFAVGPKRTVRLPVELIAGLEERALRALGRLHAARPRHSTIPRAQLAAEFPDLPSDALVSGLIDRLAATGKVVATSRSVALQGFQPKLSQGERKLKDELAEAVRAGGMSPPDAAELAATAGPRAPAVPDLLGLLRDEEQLVEINGQIFLDAEVARDLHRRVSERLAGGRAITMSELRDLLGTTRKFAVPIGEYLDRIGLTKREGDVRRLGPAKTAAAGIHDRAALES
jgi:selenocysteine-specific elongation factor